MVRASQLLHPQREPAAPLHAATLVLLQDDAQGRLQLLMTRRSSRASFAPSASVFPGGGIEPQDSSASALAQAQCRATQDATQRQAALAAIRETFEELGIVLARHADGRWADAHDVAQLDRHAPLAPQCQRLGLRLAVDALWPLAHWTADRCLPKRFAVPFFAAAMPPGQTPVADEREQFEPCWIAPQEALAQQASGQLHLIYPTERSLARLAGYASSAALLAALTEAPLWTSCPRTGLKNGQESRHMEHEPEYGELALVCPDGQVQHRLDWQSAQPVALLKNLLRLTAPNPGLMTGPGTNSYLVGEAATGFIVIDPGPADAGHVERLWQAAGGDIRAIVCTHSHADHAPGAAPLQQRCAQAGKQPAPPILGLPSAPTARASHFFRPDRALQNRELLALYGQGPEGKITHTLEVIYSPGHAANHLCLRLQEDGLLFSGDQILSASTTVIDPPDGNMNAYLDSLDELQALCTAQGVDFIAPAHGHVLAQAGSAIARLKAHRLAREAKVQAAVAQCPQGGLPDWLALAYADTPPALWPVAERSLRAHLERLHIALPHTP